MVHVISLRFCLAKNCRTFSLWGLRNFGCREIWKVSAWHVCLYERGHYVKKKPDIKTIPEIQNAIKSVETHLGEKGRVLVRYSGTQPLCRVMVEGPTLEETDMYCRQLTDIIQDKIG